MGKFYISGEESEEQIKIRGDRLGVKAEELYIVSETNLDVVEAYIDELEPKFVIIDSIQTIYRESISSDSQEAFLKLKNVLIHL